MSALVSKGVVTVPDTDEYDRRIYVSEPKPGPIVDDARLKLSSVAGVPSAIPNLVLPAGRYLPLAKDSEQGEIFLLRRSTVPVAGLYYFYGKGWELLATNQHLEDRETKLFSATFAKDMTFKNNTSFWLKANKELLKDTRTYAHRSSASHYVRFLEDGDYELSYNIKVYAGKHPVTVRIQPYARYQSYIKEGEQRVTIPANQYMYIRDSCVVKDISYYEYTMLRVSISGVRGGSYTKFISGNSQWSIKKIPKAKIKTPGPIIIYNRTL